jgi:hypothetical protein
VCHLPVLGAVPPLPVLRRAAASPCRSPRRRPVDAGATLNVVLPSSVPCRVAVSVVRRVGHLEIFPDIQSFQPATTLSNPTPAMTAPLRSPSQTPLLKLRAAPVRPPLFLSFSALVLHSAALGHGVGRCSVKKCAGKKNKLPLLFILVHSSSLKIHNK